MTGHWTLTWTTMDQNIEQDVEEKTSDNPNLQSLILYTKKVEGLVKYRFYSEVNLAICIKQQDTKIHFCTGS